MSVKKRRGPSLAMEVAASVVTGFLFVWAAQNIDLGKWQDPVVSLELALVLAFIGFVWWLAMSYRVKP